MKKHSRLLPLWFMMPAGIIVLLFFLIPVLLTAVFSFTTMGSETGITGSRYVISKASLHKLRDSGLSPSMVDKLGSRSFVFDEKGIKEINRSKLDKKVIKEIEAKLAGMVFSTEKELFRALKNLRNRPRSFRIAKQYQRPLPKRLRIEHFLMQRPFERVLKRSILR